MIAYYFELFPKATLVLQTRQRPVYGPPGTVFANDEEEVSVNPESPPPTTCLNLDVPAAWPETAQNGRYVEKAI